ncbi:glycoside hydrolase [Rhizodiscina lignyota]|uniref:Glycoside hydrolase n=1 Tax=Rhizodiscina lignyota TaxID=1504668 RepID=A0A9P4M295_9PEZI|nr:glycoside hydrolase [Rhizodiscina lignyota]
MTITEERKWWKEGVVYQIYPASFKDSNDDGIGDIPGIISELDYIRSIGVDIVWICPMYDSPQVDMGYDISDYEAVYPPYGTVSDMESLIHECHKRDMHIILDLVVNHTSDQHKWFKESRMSKESPKRDWYIWRPAKYVNGVRKPPNNWRSNFEGSAWQWDEATQEYYLHLFCPEQPDLNWENEEVRKAIYDSAMEFWLRKGIDGFRVDTVNMYSKGLIMPDAPVTDPDAEWQFAGYQYCNGPRMQEFLSEMNAVLAKYDAMTVGECPNTHTAEGVLKYVSAKQKQLNMVFQFDVVDVGMGPHKFQTTPFAWKLPTLKAAIAGTQTLIKGTDAWTTAFLENHDQARSISRFASDAPEHRVASGKMLALMLATLSGTLFVYQGQELGMINAPLEWSMDEYKDVDSSNYYKMVNDRSGGDPKSLASAKAALQHLARDHARTPMQWNSHKYAGFSSCKPWMRVNDDYTVCNAQQQQQDKGSVLSFWKKLLRLRKEYSDLFVYGDFELLDAANENLFSFTKEYRASKAFVVLNFTGQKQAGASPENSKLLMNTAEEPKAESLLPYEGRVYLMA